MTKAFDLALFVGTPVNPGDGVVVNTVGPPLKTQFAPVVVSPSPGVTVGASVPAATAPSQTLVSGAGPSFAWSAAAGGGGGGGIADAPNDGSAYARKSLGWSHLTHADLTDWVTATAAFTYTLPTASASTLGGVKVDGTTITIAGGVISSSGGGVADAPNDGTGYQRKSQAWSHIAHTDVTDWNATLAPYALSASLPAASTLPPLMDGTQAIGTGSDYARANHVHPSDTSRYPNSNPSGYQTASQVSASISAAAFTLPTATTTTLGGVKVDGTTISVTAGGVISSSGGGVVDAPADGNTYGRNNHAWIAVSGGGGGITDAPSDGTAYARKSVGWTNIAHTDITDWSAALSGYALTSSIPAASNDTPIVDGGAAAGTASTWARADHVHPTDTTRYSASNPAGYQTAAQVTAALPAASSTTPVMDGTAAVGTGTTWARNDHVHPVDTSRYAAANPSGYQTAAQVSASISAAAYTLPVATTTVLGGVKVDGTSVTISSGVISSTAGASPSNAAPAMDGAAAAGALATYARGDHVHPSDTSRYAATNPSGYQTAAQVTAALPVVTTSTPLMDGTATIGASGKWADGAHVHPVDTSRYATTNPAGYQTAAQVSASITAAAYVLPIASTTVLGGVKVDGSTVVIASGVISSTGGAAPSTTTPVMSGAGAVGVSTTYARSDHQHPSDTSRAPLASPVFTGTPSLPTGTTAVTQAPGNATTAPATTAFVGAAVTAGAYSLPQATTVILGGVKVDGSTITAAAGVISATASATAPAMNGTATAGAANAFSRGDHVHPTDTSRAPTASPTFTGVVTIPTGAAIATPNISGVTTASNAAAGQVGEWVAASQLTAQSLVTATAINLTSISLTAGDWDVDGDVFYQASAAVVSNFVCGVGLASLTIPAVGTPGRAQIVGAANAFVQSSFSTGRLRVNVSTTTTVYLVSSATFTSGTCTAQGTIQARRMR